jgi:hypothetical protein
METEASFGSAFLVMPKAAYPQALRKKYPDANCYIRPDISTVWSGFGHIFRVLLSTPYSITKWGVSLMPGDGTREQPLDLLRSPGMFAFGLFEEAYKEIGKLQKYALTGSDSRDGSTSGSPFLAILGRALGALYESANYPHRQRLQEMLARLQNQQQQRDVA